MSSTSSSQSPTQQPTKTTVSPSKAKPKKQYPPSQYKIDDSGNKWRLCAGAAVLNSSNELLIGERLYLTNAWQAPQGGVDDADPARHKHHRETVVEACDRELYEEMGLRVGTHVMLDPAASSLSLEPIRYRTIGTQNWLTKSGYAGQEMHWTIYRCIDSRGNLDPSTMCELEGKNGEDAEFSSVKWQSTAEVVKKIWEGKREPYEVLQVELESVKRQWEEMCESLDLSGTWTLDAALSVGVVEGLVQRGLTLDRAMVEAEKPYIQCWKRGGERTSWIVTTYDVDGTTPRRVLTYAPGEREETYQETTILFRPSGDESVQLKRHMAFLAEPDAEPVSIAHVTLTQAPRGVEEARRYLKGDKFILRRTLWPAENADRPIVSTEVFVRC